jgi:hypothetical protein
MAASPSSTLSGDANEFHAEKEEIVPSRFRYETDFSERVSRCSHLPPPGNSPRRLRVMYHVEQHHVNIGVALPVNTNFKRVFRDFGESP